VTHLIVITRHCLLRVKKTKCLEFVMISFRFPYEYTFEIRVEVGRVNLLGLVSAMTLNGVCFVLYPSMIDIALRRLSIEYINSSSRPGRFKHNSGHVPVYLFSSKRHSMERLLTCRSRTFLYTLRWFFVFYTFMRSDCFFRLRGGFCFHSVKPTPPPREDVK